MKRFPFLFALNVAFVVLLPLYPSYPMMHPAQGRFLQRDPAEYVDGMNSNEYLGGAPTSYVDPFAGKRRQLKGNMYGDWEIWQEEKPGDEKEVVGQVYSSKTDIWFKPKKEKVCCKEIAFIQLFKMVRKGEKHPRRMDIQNNVWERRSADGWMVDQSSGRVPWYAHGADGRPYGYTSYGCSPDPVRNAWMRDIPTYMVYPSTMIWEFETTAMCKEGLQKAFIYGSLKWGFTADSHGKIVADEPETIGLVSSEGYGAMRAWNGQARNPNPSRRAHSDQEEIRFEVHQDEYEADSRRTGEYRGPRRHRRPR